MTFYVLIVSLILLALLAASSYLLYQHFQLVDRLNNLSSNKFTDDRSKQSKSVMFILLGLALSSIIIAFIAPVVLTGPAITSDFDFSGTGQIGDTLGGIMNPFIAISGVIVTGLAFYIQYKANAQQRELFYKEQELNNKQLQEQINSQSSQYRLQQFDSQFYELLRLHRENINEMIITGYNYWEKEEGLERYNVATRGRKLFVVMKTEFHCILRIYKDVRSIDKEGFKVCYNIFFFGLDQFKRNYPNETKLIELLSNARKKHEEPDLEIIKSNKDRKIYSDDTSLYFNYKPFSGHASRLSHYFRHLYLTAKTIATTEIISEYEEKMKYFRMLRAQLSVHEQILLYYNWLSGFGSEWENGKNSLFTEYCMIRNLWFNDLFIDAFINSNIDILRNKETKFRKGKMFENDN